MYISNDYGMNWGASSFNLFCGTILINLANNDIFIGNHMGIYISRNGGITWEGTAFQSNANALALTKEQDIFVGYWRGISKMNYIGTQTDTVLTLADGILVTSIVQNHNGYLFAGTVNFFGNSGVYRSFDGGDTWEHCWQVPYYIFSLAIDSAGVVYAGSAGNGTGLFRSFDQGTTWEIAKVGVAVFSIVIAPNNDIYIGCSSEYGPQGGVHRSTDNGATWETLNTGLPNLVVELLYLSPAGYLFAGLPHEYGHPLFRSANTVFTNIQTTENYNFLRVFPNPINSVLTYSTCPSFAGKKALLKIFALTGQVLVTEQVQLDVLNHVVTNTLAQGTYLFYLKINNQTCTTRIVKF
jgi:hypothetical protein